MEVNDVGGVQGAQPIPPFSAGEGGRTNSASTPKAARTDKADISEAAHKAYDQAEKLGGGAPRPRPEPSEPRWPSETHKQLVEGTYGREQAVNRAVDRIVDLDKKGEL